MVRRYRGKYEPRRPFIYRERPQLPVGTTTLLRYLGMFEMSMASAQEAKHRANQFLSQHPELEAEFHAFEEAGGGTVDDFHQWLKEATTRPDRPKIRLIWCREKGRRLQRHSGRSGAA